MSKTKIAYLIKGIGAYNSHIKPLIDNCPFEDFDFIILHLNRLFTPKDIIQDPRVRFVDLTLNWNLKKVFANNELNLITTINPGNIFDIFTVSLANSLGIPTVYYQHGIQLDFTSFDQKKLIQGISGSRKVKSIYKYLFFIFYFIFNLFLVKDKWFFFNSIFLKMSYLIFPKLHKNIPKYGLRKTHCNYAFVYGEHDRRYLMESMGMENSKIFITGYPFLKPSNSFKVENENKIALFISAGLRSVGVIPLSLNQEIQFYRKLSERVNEIGYVLYVKLHPLENIDDFKILMSSNLIRFFKNENLANMTKYSALIIGEYSTALFYPIKYFKPLFILKSEFFDHYPFDFTKYGVGISTTMETITEDMKIYFELNDQQFKDYNLFLSEYVMNSNDEDPIGMYYDKIREIVSQNS